MPAIKSAARAHESRLKKRATEEKLETAGMMRWLLTYADMITLLLALFIILFSISTINKVKLQRLVHDISGGFNSVDAINNPPEGGGLEHQQPSKGAAARTADHPNLHSAKASAGSGYRASDERRARHLAVDGQSAVRQRQRRVASRDRRSCWSKSARILRRTQPTVRVEGYTDNTPIHTSLYPTNWELSAARAAGVTRFLVEKGYIDPHKISACRIRGIPSDPSEWRFQRPTAQ